jgi:hypothetical protein
MDGVHSRASRHASAAGGALPMVMSGDTAAADRYE